MDWKLDVEVYNLSVGYVGVHNTQKIVKGCCMELAGFLKRENLDLIMEIMKFSISRTLIIVSHRVITLEDCDIIHYLKPYPLKGNRRQQP